MRPRNLGFLALRDLINGTEKGFGSEAFHTQEVSQAQNEKGQSLPGPLDLCVPVSLLQSAVCLDWTYPDEGDFPGKVVWKYGERKKQSPNSKSMFHSISLPLCVCVCCFMSWAPSQHSNGIVTFLSDHSKVFFFNPGLPVHTGVRQNGSGMKT